MVNNYSMRVITQKAVMCQPSSIVVRDQICWR